MKNVIWVAYKDYGYEGYDEPVAAGLTPEAVLEQIIKRYTSELVFYERYPHKKKVDGWWYYSNRPMGVGVSEGWYISRLEY